MGVKVGRIHSQPQGVTSWRYGLLSNYFGHTFCYIMLAYFVVACFQKADKEHLDAKVNCSRFEATCVELKRLIDSTLNKLLGSVRCASGC